jgi:hypothetical protein
MSMIQPVASNGDKSLMEERVAIKHIKDEKFFEDWSKRTGLSIETLK